VIPHLTVAHGVDADVLRDIERELRSRLPIVHPGARRGAVRVRWWSLAVAGAAAVRADELTVALIHPRTVRARRLRQRLTPGSCV
jgi:hypothetical protein